MQSLTRKVILYIESHKNMPGCKWNDLRSKGGSQAVSCKNSADLKRAHAAELTPFVLLSFGPSNFGGFDSENLGENREDAS